MPLPIPFIPSTTAPTHPGRFRGGATAPGALSSSPGGPFLSDVFGTGARQVVEAAFGADLSEPPELWTWTDITTYVQWTPGVNVRINPGGVSSRRLVASSLTGTLRNDQPGGGDWTIGNAIGRWGSSLRENTPIRARLDIGNGPSTRFFGYLTSIPPTRDAAGRNMVALTAHGIGRRLAKGKSAPFSAMRKSLDRALPDAYWSLEQGQGGVVGATAVSGGRDMTVTSGSVAFGSADNSLPSSLALAQFSRDGVAGQLTGVIPGATGTGNNWSIEFVFKSPKLGVGDFIIITHWNVTGTIDLWDVVATPVAAGGLTLRYINTVGGLGTYTSGVAVDDGDWHHVRVDCQQTGGIAVQLILDGQQIINQSTTGTNGQVTTVVINPTADADSAVPALGHFAVWNSDRPNSEDTYAAFAGHTGETVAERMVRLSDEADVTLEIIGAADDRMGPQRAGAYLDMLQDAVDVDAGGILLDGLGAGLTYYARQGGYSKSAILTLRSADGDFPGPITPVHSDQDRVNRYVARDPQTNADRSYERTDGLLGSDPSTGVGVYEDGGDHRVNILDQLNQIAAWKVGLGTVPGLRWPSLTLQLAKPSTAVKAQDWLNAMVLDRVDTIGIDTGSNPDRSLLLRGWSETWNRLMWSVVTAFQPYDGYAVTTLAADTGDTSEFLGWLDVDTVQVATTVAAGDASVVCNVTGATLTNPTVSTYADDLVGLYINLDGLRVGVTAISAPAAGQQTISVTGTDVLRAVPVGAYVMAWDPVIPGL